VGGREPFRPILVRIACAAVVLVVALGVLAA
jgi:hypothetical protein